MGNDCRWNSTSAGAHVAVNGNNFTIGASCPPLSHTEASLHGLFLAPRSAFRRLCWYRSFLFALLVELFPLRHHICLSPFHGGGCGHKILLLKSSFSLLSSKQRSMSCCRKNTCLHSATSFLSAPADTKKYERSTHVSRDPSNVSSRGLQGERR